MNITASNQLKVALFSAYGGEHSAPAEKRFEAGQTTRHLFLRRELDSNLQSAVLNQVIQTPLDWLHYTGQYTAERKRDYSPIVINATATNLLAKMGIKRADGVPAATQLCNHVFDTVINQAEVNDRRRFINLAASASGSELRVTNWQIRFYSLGQKVSAVAGNVFVRLVLSFVLWRVAKRVYPPILNKIRIKVLPKLANRFINATSAKTVARTLKVYDIGMAIYARKIWITIGYLLAQHTRLGNVPGVRQMMSVMKTVMDLPSTIAKKIAWLPYNLSVGAFHTQRRVADAAAAQLRNAEDAKLILAGTKAKEVFLAHMGVA